MQENIEKQGNMYKVSSISIKFDVGKYFKSYQKTFSRFACKNKYICK